MDTTVMSRVVTLLETVVETDKERIIHYSSQDGQTVVAHFVQPKKEASNTAPSVIHIDEVKRLAGASVTSEEK